MLITEEDLAGYQAKVVEPLVLPYRDVELVLLPYQAGGITIGETLNILNGFDLGATGFNTAATLHLIAEASRRGFADRFAYVGDPAFVATDWQPTGLGRLRGGAASGDRSHAGFGPRAGRRYRRHDSQSCRGRRR